MVFRQGFGVFILLNSYLSDFIYLLKQSEHLLFEHLTFLGYLASIELFIFCFRVVFVASEYCDACSFQIFGYMKTGSFDANSFSDLDIWKRLDCLVSLSWCTSQFSL